jgi:uncharacterized membrane protein
MNDTAPTTARHDRFLWIMMLLVSLMLSWLSIARYVGYNAAMFDLGNMTQAIWSGSQGQPLLYSRPEGFAASRLAGHVELGYFLLAPIYALFPDPRTLLVFQALLFASGAFAAYRLAARRTQSHFAARCVALCYLFYPTALTSVLFDIHADTFAMPILMWVLDALEEKAWWRYAILVAIALSFKFYVAAAIAGIGFVLIMWGKQRRPGILTISIALAYGAIAFFVIRPLFAHTTAGGTGAVTSNYLSYYFGQSAELAQTALERLVNALVVFGPVLLLAWRGWRWLVPGMPIAAAALISTGPAGTFDFRYHHYAVVVPFIIMALIDGIAQAQSLPRKRGGRSWSGDLRLCSAIVVICSALLVNIPLNPLFWLGIPGYGFDHTSYGTTSRDALKEPFLAQIPADAPVMVSNFLAPHAVNRPVVYLTRYPDEASGPERLPNLLPQVDYVVADALFDFYLPIDGGYAGGVDGDREAITLLLNNSQFGLAQTNDGLLLFSRAQAGKGLQQQIEQIPDDGRPAQQTYGDRIELVASSSEQIGPQRVRLSFTWRLKHGFAERRYVAVTHVQEELRYVHLPSFALLPAWQWQPGVLYIETFEIDLPPAINPTQLNLRTDWYDIASPYAFLTDSRSVLEKR